MQNKPNSDVEFKQDESINIYELFLILFKERWIILITTFFASILSIIFSLSLPNIYHSKSILSPVESSDGISGALKSYTGIANLAGVNLPSEGSNTNSVKAIEKLNSLSFFEDKILPKIFLPELMAVDSWNHKNNQINFDEDLYDLESNNWIRDVEYPKKQKPSAQESFKVFKDEHLILNKNEQTGFLVLGIKHSSPYIAKKWTDLLIDEINSYYREKDSVEAEIAVTYLNNQIINTKFTEIKTVMAELLQQEIQKLTLIEANESYVFDIIDPPSVMEEKSEPSRALICILGAILGGMLGSLLALIKNYFLIKEPYQD